MFKKIPFGFLLLLGLVYVGFGDQFLPPSIGQYSVQARRSLDGMMIGMFPEWRPKTNPYSRTEDALQKTEQGGKSK
ncbi:MAG: hypothetical protein H7126_11585 [Candidatus Parcubacteria bacterium]|uniref:hypothetical protein n=1 Tax=Phormidesmis priestleyi TaxID=268141 RepID=UPI00083B92A2|nr:hypothetical protein [Phormidesmis priestleyi]MBC7824492.1 hypothetical protein [Leptolyngbyaceae cyanobacterium LF-bin-113]